MYVNKYSHSFVFFQNLIIEKYSYIFPITGIHLSLFFFLHVYVNSHIHTSNKKQKQWIPPHPPMPQLSTSRPTRTPLAVAMQYKMYNGNRQKLNQAAPPN